MTYKRDSLARTEIGGAKVNLFDDSPEIRTIWSLSRTARHDALLGQMKKEFELLHREGTPSKPLPRERPVPAIRQPQSQRSGRFSYKVG